MTTAETKEEEGPIDPAFTNSATWVAQWLCPNLEREIKRTFEWCPQWWDHPEAVQRIEAMWRAWEVLRAKDGTGMSTWWIDHADPHLALLCNPDIGPFGHCHSTHGRDIAPLRTTEPPDDWPHWVTGAFVQNAPPASLTDGADDDEDGASQAGAHEADAHEGGAHHG